MSALVVELEQRAMEALPPPSSVEVAGWMIPLGDGPVGRLSAVTTFGRRPQRLIEAVDAIEDAFQRRGRSPSFRLTHLDADLDAFLDSRGFTRSADVLVMVGPALRWSATAIEEAPDVETWSASYQRFGEHDSERAAEIGDSLRRLTLPHALLHTDHAVGVVVVHKEWAGLFDIAVDTTVRRSGHGRRLSKGLMTWAAHHGATRCYLQVHSENEPAIALYRSLGFGETYRYWYRYAPSSTSR